MKTEGLGLPGQARAPGRAGPTVAGHAHPCAADVGTVRLSVVIPCHNAAGLLAEQLEALAAQRWQGVWEVIVVDDGSQDDPAATVARYGAHLPSLRLHRTDPCRGAAHARNLGARIARGELLLFLDADDVIAPDWLGAIERSLREHGAVASRIDTARLNPPERRASRTLQQEHGLPRYPRPPFLPHASGCGLGVRREWHEAVGGFDESLQRLEDTDYTWRLQLAGADLHFAPDALVHMRFREGAAAAFEQAFGYGRYSVRLERRYRPKEAQPLTVGREARSLLRHVRDVGDLADPMRRLRWWRRLAKRSGRLVGLLEASRTSTPSTSRPARPATRWRSRQR